MSRCICCLFLALCVSLVFPAYSDGGVVWSYNDREAYADYGGNGVILGSDTKTDAGPTVEPTTLTASIGSGSLAASANATVSTNHTEASGVHTFTGSGSTTLYSYLSNYSYYEVFSFGQDYIELAVNLDQPYQCQITGQLKPDSYYEPYDDTSFGVQIDTSWSVLVSTQHTTVPFDYTELLSAGPHTFYALMRYELVDADGWGKDASASFNYQIVLTPVPEPGTLGILGLCIAARVSRRRK